MPQRATKRCLVKFLGAVEQIETNAELVVQRFRVIAHHTKTAALRYAIGALISGIIADHVWFSRSQHAVPQTSFLHEDERESAQA
jgi:hypothetical protein